MSSSLVTLFGLTFNIYGVIIAAILISILLAVWSAHRSQRLDWRDLITREGTSNRVELTKILQLVGGVVSTWIVIQMTLSGSLTWDMFAIYLAYVASVEGFAKVVTAKYSNQNNNGYGGYGGGGYNGGGYNGGNSQGRNTPPDIDGDNPDSDDTRPPESKKTTD